MTKHLLYFSNQNTTKLIAKKFNCNLIFRCFDLNSRSVVKSYFFFTDVTYEAKVCRSRHLEEWERKMNITCPRGKFIQITDALYGRKDTELVHPNMFDREK